MPHADPDRRREYSREYQRKRYAQNREKIRAYHAEWRKRNPEKWRGYTAAWRAANPEKSREVTRRYFAAHPEVRRKHWRAYRARKRGASVSIPFDRAEIILRDGSRCHLCGKKVPVGEITLDHLVPLSRGGEHSPLNVRVAHARCNSSRGAGRKPAQLILT